MQLTRESNSERKGEGGDEVKGWVEIKIFSCRFQEMLQERGR